MTYHFHVVTISGSMRFYDEMLKQAERLSREGAIVLMPFITFAPGSEQESAAKIMLDRMHFAKIDMSHSIFVVNVGGYIGESTQNEIEYAADSGKPIQYLEKR